MEVSIFNLFTVRGSLRLEDAKKRLKAEDTITVISVFTHRWRMPHQQCLQDSFSYLKIAGFYELRLSTSWE
jgi:hypothetical protein